MEALHENRIYNDDPPSRGQCDPVAVPATNLTLPPTPANKTSLSTQTPKSSSLFAMDSPVTTRDSDETAPPIEDNMLSAHPCPNSSRKSVDLDIPGPGQPTPQLAVAPYALGSAILLSEENGTATVLGLAGYGEPTRVFKVTKREDGWWPDSYVECPR